MVSLRHPVHLADPANPAWPPNAVWPRARHPGVGPCPGTQVGGAPAEPPGRATPMPVQRLNPDSIVHPFPMATHPHPVAGDHCKAVIRRLADLVVQ